MSKKIVTSITFALALILLFTSTVSAKGFTSVRLIDTGFYHEKGVTFKFQVTGDFNPNKKINAYLTVSGKTIKAGCNYNQRQALYICTARGGTAKNYQGQGAIINFAGYTFYTYIPAKPWVNFLPGK